MPLGADDVRHVAALARLRVGDADATRLAEDLTRALDEVARLPEVGPADPAAPATESVAGGADRRRPDVPRPEAERAALAEAVLAESAGRVGRGVRVPPAIGG